MKKNMGNIDRVIRIIIVAIIAMLYWKGIIGGTLAYTLIAVAVIFLITSFISFCPLYSIVGLNTCKMK